MRKIAFWILSWADGQFTNDASNAIFYRDWLHNAQGWSYWTNTIATGWSSNIPARESRSMGTVSYNWQTWITKLTLFLFLYFL
jgi:hypothetical protein